MGLFDGRRRRRRRRRRGRRRGDGFGTRKTTQDHSLDDDDDEEEEEEEEKREEVCTVRPRTMAAGGRRDDVDQKEEELLRYPRGGPDGVGSGDEDGVPAPRARVPPGQTTQPKATTFRRKRRKRRKRTPRRDGQNVRRNDGGVPVPLGPAPTDTARQRTRREWNAHVRRAD